MRTSQSAGESHLGASAPGAGASQALACGEAALTMRVCSASGLLSSEYFGHREVAASCAQLRNVTVKKKGWQPNTLAPKLWRVSVGRQPPSANPFGAYHCGFTRFKTRKSSLPNSTDTREDTMKRPPRHDACGSKIVWADTPEKLRQTTVELFLERPPRRAVLDFCALARPAPVRVAGIAVYNLDLLSRPAVTFHLRIQLPGGVGMWSYAARAATTH
jgi:hypothetical protein